MKTKEFLHPNPASRAKMSAVKGISKLSGQAKAQTYPQPEGVLGDAMITYGKKLGDESMYGESAYGESRAYGELAYGKARACGEFAYGEARAYDESTYG